jgi:transposase
MAAIEKTRRYPTDLTDEEWSQVEGLLPKPRKTGRRRGVDLREVAFGEVPTLRVLVGGALVLGAVIADIIGDSRTQRQ